MAELVDPVVRACEADAAAGVIAGVQPFGVEALVQLDRVAEEPHQVVARVELRAEAGGVPGGAARQLRLFEHDDAVPTALCEVIRETAAGNAASDDRDPDVLDGRRSYASLGRCAAAMSSPSACTTSGRSSTRRTCCGVQRFFTYASSRISFSERPLRCSRTRYSATSSSVCGRWKRN